MLREKTLDPFLGWSSVSSTASSAFSSEAGNCQYILKVSIKAIVLSPVFPKYPNVEMTFYEMSKDRKG